MTFFTANKSSQSVKNLEHTTGLTKTYNCHGFVNRIDIFDSIIQELPLDSGELSECLRLRRGHRAQHVRDEL